MSDQVSESRITQWQMPFFIVALSGGPDEERKELARIMLRVSRFLYEESAPSELIREMLSVVEKWLDK